MTRDRFPNPFPRNHCVPIAFTHAAQYLRPDPDLSMWTASAVSLASRARAVRYLTRSGVALNTLSRIDWWAERSGLKVTKVARYLRDRYGIYHGGEFTLVSHYKTLVMWASQHTRGAYVVSTRGHMVAVCGGVIYGYFKPRARVTAFAQLEAA